MNGSRRVKEGERGRIYAVALFGASGCGSGACCKETLRCRRSSHMLTYRLTVGKYRLLAGGSGQTQEVISVKKWLSIGLGLVIAVLIVDRVRFFVTAPANIERSQNRIEPVPLGIT